MESQDESEQDARKPVVFAQGNTEAHANWQWNPKGGHPADECPLLVHCLPR